jgi:large subunit ribosomal protein L25
MKEVSLSGSLRENVGKKDTKALRRAGLVPCVVYGGENQTHFAVKSVDLNKLIYTSDVYKVELDIDGKKITSVIKELQFHPVTDKVIHADFIELIDDKEIKIDLPVILKGNALGVRNGGRLLTVYRTLSLKGLPSAFPDDIEIDITELRIGEKIRVDEVSIPGLTILAPDNAVICGIKMARGATDEEEEEEGEEGETEGEEGEAKSDSEKGSES